MILSSRPKIGALSLRKRPASPDKRKNLSLRKLDATKRTFSRMRHYKEVSADRSLQRQRETRRTGAHAYLRVLYRTIEATISSTPETNHECEREIDRLTKPNKSSRLIDSGEAKWPAIDRPG